MPSAKAELPYRPCVGVCLLNAEGLAWIGRRIPKWEGDRSRHVWQMPQGGIDKGEAPRAAAFRELGEEIGTDNAEIVAETPGWLTYDLPPEALGVALKGKYCGQRQKWFAMRFLGRDADIDIAEKPGHEAEFDQWRWAPLEDLPALIVPFKRQIYEAVAAAFADLPAQLRGGAVTPEPWK